MEYTMNCRERYAVIELFDCITDAYRCFLNGSRPSQSAADVASLIYLGVCGVVAGEDRVSVSSKYCHQNTGELTCISVTLVEKIISSLMSQSQPAEVVSYCVEVLRVLFQDTDLMSQLVRLFQNEDQMISHLAAKSVSTCVFYRLHKSRTVSPVWQQKCVQSFNSSPPGAELDACLWSLTEVLKRLLKGAYREILEKLLEAFDSSLSALCSKFLPEGRKKAAHPLVDFISSRHWGTTFYLLLDLLEVLTASSLTCGAGVCLRSQRITHIHSSALLTAVSLSSDGFVKKRALLLLKKALLQKAGEDWALEEVLSPGLKYEHFNSDMTTLAQTVLTAVAANWLQGVHVGSASFFGGTRRIQGDKSQKSDSVMLRTVSLLLLKSMVLHIQTAGGTGVDSAVHGYLQSLWAFLRRCSVQLTEVTHLCCWISLVFGEQDDDMMEAAKALLSIFLHHRPICGLDDDAVLEAACVSGFNPHCHFLLLLQSVSFDHSILLDFLISAETCFLEYLAQYLKYLRTDWQGFTAACARISVSDCPVLWQESLAYSCGGDMAVSTCKGESEQVEFSPCFQPTDVISPVERIGFIAGLRLVEYDSSDYSDPENMELSALDIEQETSTPQVSIRQKEYKSSDSTLLSDPNFPLERRPDQHSLPVIQNEQASCTNMAPPSGHMSCEMSTRVVLCLSQLSEVVTRLQTKNLFPYNPSSLLRLLAQVNNCFQQWHLSQLNKQ
uniref:protein Lines homolog 1 isoform X2 n=1 Tax=Monopterus albus TaxID=43700 RepID=UPI0009B48F5D|nr:protein Lines homolog 1 isoform X2 [Monopterus albus]